jgi:hypothetical protein
MASGNRDDGKQQIEEQKWLLSAGLDQVVKPGHHSVCEAIRNSNDE